MISCTPWWQWNLLGMLVRIQACLGYENNISFTAKALHTNAPSSSPKSVLGMGRPVAEMRVLSCKREQIHLPNKMYVCKLNTPVALNHARCCNYDILNLAEEKVRVEGTKIGSCTGHRCNLKD